VVSGDSVTLSWNSVTGAASYNVYHNSEYALDPSEFRLDGAVSGTSYTLTDLGSQTYGFKVTAVDSGGNESPQSDSVFAVVTDGLDAPSAVGARAQGNAVVVSWSGVDVADYYNIYRQDDRYSSWRQIASTTDTSYVDLPEIGYMYGVAAVKSNGKSSGFLGVFTFGSSTAGRRPLPAPTSIQARPEGGDGILVSWNNVMDVDVPAVYYDVYRSDSEYGEYTLIARGSFSGAYSHEYIDSGLSAGTRYYYKVSATGSDNRSAAAKHEGEAGLFFDDGQNPPVKAEILAVNEPRTIKAIVPAGLTAGTDYALKIVTQSPAKGGGALLKNLRELRSEFKLTAQNPIRLGSDYQTGLDRNPDQGRIGRPIRLSSRS
jgi:fibronectin type 3 domain-containing protein